MDEYTADAFANRDESVPAIAVSGSLDLSGASSDSNNEHSESKRERLKNKLSGSRAKENVHDAGRRDTGTSLQDRLFSK